MYYSGIHCSWVAFSYNSKTVWALSGLNGPVNNVVCAISKASDQPAQTCSLIRAFASRLNIL